VEGLVALFVVADCVVVATTVLVSVADAVVVSTTVALASSLVM